MITKEDVLTLRAETGAGFAACKEALIKNNGDFSQAINYLRLKGVALAAKKNANRLTKDGTVFIKSNKEATVLLSVNCETDFVAKSKDFQDFLIVLGDLALMSQVKNLDDLKAIAEEKLIAVIAKTGEKITLASLVKYIVSDNKHCSSYLHATKKLGVVLEYEGENTALNQEIVHNLTLQLAAMKPDYLSANEIPESVLEQEKTFIKTQLLNQGKKIKSEFLEKIIQGKLSKYYSEHCLLEQNYLKDPDLTVAQYLKQTPCPLALTRFALIEIKQESQK